MADLKQLSATKCFGGQQKVYSHTSAVCKSSMKFSIYVPPAVTEKPEAKFPVVYFLAELHSNINEFPTLSGFQRFAAENNLVVVSPDSSPRNTGIPGEKDEDVFYGQGASWYLDAITDGWKDHYNMFTYVTEELISVIEQNFKFVQAGRRGIMGHAMGGHGSLICALKKPQLYQSVSSMSPCCNVSANGGDMDVAYVKYLGFDKNIWKQWDVSELIKTFKTQNMDILVDIGSCDALWDCLMVWQLVTASKGQQKLNLDINVRGGYDHEYDFVASFIESQLKYHADILNSSA